MSEEESELGRGPIEPGEDQLHLHGRGRQDDDGAPEGVRDMTPEEFEEIIGSQLKRSRATRCIPLRERPQYPGDDAFREHRHNTQEGPEGPEGSPSDPLLGESDPEESNEIVKELLGDVEGAGPLQLRTARQVAGYLLRISKFGKAIDATMVRADCRGEHEAVLEVIERLTRLRDQELGAMSRTLAVLHTLQDRKAAFQVHSISPRKRRKRRSGAA